MQAVTRLGLACLALPLGNVLDRAQGQSFRRHNTSEKRGTMKDRQQHIRVQIAALSSEEVGVLVAELEMGGAQDIDVDDGGAGVVDPVTGAVVAAIVVGLVIQVGRFATFLVNWWERRNKPGLIIDARGDQIKVIETTSVPYGQVITFMPDGTKQEYTDADGGEGMADYVARVIEGLSDLMPGAKQASGGAAPQAGGGAPPAVDA